MKKFLSLISLLSVLINLSLADDLLAKLTKGKLSDYSNGVKVLSFDEMKEVKGGYVVNFYYGSDWSNSPEMYAVALYSGEEFSKGLCPIGKLSCSNHNEVKLIAFNQAVNQKRGEYGFFPVYIIKREIKISNRGTPYVLFSYKTGAVDKNLQLYKFNSTTSSSHLNNNILIREIANKYKDYMETQLGR
ncbi:bacteriocin [Campylobacter sp. MIT 99-7217]|uniref:bacteriocin n=1 Tax=Campylobacter sp. MIT 99-7217 TaxID=535091 RepID=UPI00115ADCF9|nr:bacteriocin [Campylobacter sp. MIT 99-7217]TQR34434.1 bacteriocin [Campylobacter sp. MIT 99-7217]